MPLCTGGENQDMGILYKPDDGIAADFIPFHWDGQYHLFYLKDFRNAEKYGEGTPWFHLVTRDFVRFEDLGEALPRGPVGSQDLWVFTGSVIEKDGVFHIFYTGHNSHFQNTDKPIQAVMHATSYDMRTWAKDPNFIFFAPADKGFEANDWRDPFVFWNDEKRKYWMLLAARKTVGPSRNRGCIALAVSQDLENWQVREPFWAPDQYFTHECPDLFRIGDWWYLVYSTFSERFVTHYRMARSLKGPWLAPANDTFDGRAYYAAKTAGDGQDRFAFGWLATRSEGKDDGSWNWGGNLVVHQIEQQKDGTLTVRIPVTVLDAFKTPVSCEPRAVLGNWNIEEHRVTAHSVGRLSILKCGHLPETCLVEAEMTFSQNTAGLGLLLRADEDLDRYYAVRLEPANQRIVFDRWPRPGDQPFMIERPLHLTAEQPVRLQIIIDETCVVVYADGKVALSCRMYQHQAGELCLFVSEGEVSFRDVAIKAKDLQ